MVYDFHLAPWFTSGSVIALELFIVQNYLYLKICKYGKEQSTSIIAKFWNGSFCNINQCKKLCAYPQKKIMVIYIYMAIDIYVSSKIMEDYSFIAYHRT